MTKPAEPTGQDGVYQFPRFSSHSDDYLVLPYQQSSGLVLIVVIIMGKNNTKIWFVGSLDSSNSLLEF